MVAQFGLRRRNKFDTARMSRHCAYAAHPLLLGGEQLALSSSVSTSI
jgi:hypothetical protein